AGLVVELVVAGVLVLRPLRVGQLAATEAQHPATVVEDREQDPSAEEVLETPRPVLEPEPRRLEVRPTHPQVPCELVPRVGRPPEAVVLDLLGVEPAAAQVRPGGGGVGRGAEPLVVPLRRLFGQLEQAGPPLAARPLVVVVVAEGDAGPAGE